MSLTFRNKRFATIQSSWLEPRKVREMTIVGTRRMIVYDDLQTLEKIRIYDVRVERPPHYDTFAEFHYSYHYGDSYIPTSQARGTLESRVPAFSRLHRERQEATDRWPAGTSNWSRFSRRLPLRWRPMAQR